MKLRHRIAMIFGAAALIGSLAPVAPVQAQDYGGGTVDCYISAILAPSPLQSGQPNEFIAQGGNHGTIGGTCTVTGSIAKVGGGYSRDFRSVELVVAANGTFEVGFGDRVNAPGEYRIEVCATAAGPNATHPADDCKTITRNAVKKGGGGGGGTGKVDCYIGSISAPSPLQSGEANKIVARGGNQGSAAGTCRVTGSVSKNGGGYNRNFRTLTLDVPAKGTFQVHFTERASKPGQYSIQVCATATANGTDPGDDCKTISRKAV